MTTIVQDKSLLSHALSIKKRFLAMYKAANAGHIGSALSCTEGPLTFIQFGWRKEGDEIILSKGHAAAALYSMLAEAGFISEETIGTFYKNYTVLAAHPPAKGIKQIPFATGSLGHGLSLSAGMVLASRLKGRNKTVFCITSDGELNEGSTWEAAQFIARHNLINLVWFIDHNKLQGFGTTAEVMDAQSPDAKLAAFGFEVYNINGHNFEDFYLAKTKYENADRPVVIVCNTIKGKGWQKYEDTVDCHYLPFDEEQYEKTIFNLEKQFNGN